MRIHANNDLSSFLATKYNKNGCVFKLNNLTDICNGKSVTVNAIPSEEEKQIEEAKKRKDEITEEIKAKEIELKLTPPIITAWTYQLAYGLHKGMWLILVRHLA